MTFQDLVVEIKTLRPDETRAEQEDYLEIVVPSHAVPSLRAVLDRFFGPAFKDAGKNPSAEAQARSKGYGGVQKNQVLYYTERENQANCAMLWPWSDGRHVTVKIAQGLPKR